MQILRRELTGHIQELLYMIGADPALPSPILVSHQDGGATPVVEREGWLLHHYCGAPGGDGGGC